MILDLVLVAFNAGLAAVMLFTGQFIPMLIGLVVAAYSSYRVKKYLDTNFVRKDPDGNDEEA